MSGTEMAVYGILTVGAGMLSRMAFGRRKPDPEIPTSFDTFLVDFSTGIMHQTGTSIRQDSAEVLMALNPPSGQFMVVSAPHGKYQNNEHWPTVKNRKS